MNQLRLSPLVLAVLSFACDVESIEHSSSRDPGDLGSVENCGSRATQVAARCVDPLRGNDAVSDCGPGYLQAFSHDGCFCNPRVPEGEVCTPKCTTDGECAYVDPDHPDSHTCNSERGLCEEAISCLTHTDCAEGLSCVDTLRTYYATEDGEVYPFYDELARRCVVAGPAQVGEACEYSEDCLSAACVTDPANPSRRICGRPCTANADCEAAEHCLQSSFGPPTCQPEVAGCGGAAEPHLLCRGYSWIRGCSSSADCEGEGDCVFPASADPNGYYDGLGFGLGSCEPTQGCRDDQFRSQHTDAQLGPTCLTSDPCWRDDDCSQGDLCIALDHFQTTMRCGSPASLGS